MTNNEDHENQNDSGMIQDDSGLSDIPNDSGLADIPAPDYDMDDNAEDRGTEGNLPNLHISEDDDDAMGESRFCGPLKMLVSPNYAPVKKKF